MENLFIVGAQRSGTTYLYKILDSHPQISMARPIRPEPKFFLDIKKVELGRAYYENLYFSELPEQVQVCGEKSTSYIESPTAAKAIKQFYPDAKIIIILRNPVKRAYSNYRFSKENNLEHLDFGSAISQEKTRIQESSCNTSVSPYAYTERSKYINYIKAYEKIFAPKNIRIIIFEEFVNNIQSIQETYKWLNIDHKFNPSGVIQQVVNASKCTEEISLKTKKALIDRLTPSLLSLEEHLDRKIDIWREDWEL